MPFLGTTPTQGFVSAVTKQSFTPNGSTTAFTLSHSVANENDLEVFVGNVRQEPGSGKAYTAAGTTLTMSEAVASGVNFYVIFKNKAQVTTTPPVNSISTDKIVANAISTAKIADDAVTSAKLDTNIAVAGTLGVTGASTLTGDLAVDTNTLKVDSTNNRVGILEASPQAPLHITTGANTNIMRFGADARWGFQRANSDSRYLSLSRAMNGTPSAVMVVDGDNGAITKPLQPAFLVEPSNNAANQNIAVGSDVTVTFGTEIFDQNGDFASNTFTAPVTGKYQLQTALRVQSLSYSINYYFVLIKTSNRSYINILDPDFGQDSSYFTFTLSVLADMDANDTAIVTIYQPTGSQQTDIIDDSIFSGYLVC